MEIVNEIEMKKKVRVSTINFKKVKKYSSKRNISDKSDFFSEVTMANTAGPAGTRIKILNKKCQKVKKYQKYISTYIFH